jgi:4'-phosphopantetheinyl transferase
MITVYYTEIGTIPGDALWQQHLNKLPEEIKEKILTYTSLHDQMARLCGKLLVSELLRHYGLDASFSVKDLQYDKWGKPFFNASFDFNIAHSGSIVVCAGARDAKTGMDIEEMDEADINLMSKYFTGNEWAKINSSTHAGLPDKTLFYKLWVRKEACLKANGKGLFQPLQEIDVCGKELLLDGATWYLHDIFIKENYAACIATNKKDKAIEITRIDLNTLIN